MIVLYLEKLIEQNKTIGIFLIASSLGLIVSQNGVLFMNREYSDEEIVEIVKAFKL